MEMNVYQWKMDKLHIYMDILPNNKNECTNSLSSKWPELGIMSVFS